MNKYKEAIVIAALTSALSFTANGTSISYEVSNIAGNTWEYTYTVENDTLGIDIEEFTIYFNLGVYENLVAGVTPANWDPLVLEPDPLLPDDGVYDALALISGIAPGDLLSGFSVQFDFLSAGTPGVQFFEVVDASFNVLDDGFTHKAAASGVPEPGMLLLVALGFLGLAERNRGRFVQIG